MHQLPTSDHQILADSIRRTRVLWGIATREELAKRANVRPDVVTWAETGEGDRPVECELKRVVNELRFTGKHARLVQNLIGSVLGLRPPISCLCPSAVKES